MPIDFWRPAPTFDWTQPKSEVRAPAPALPQLVVAARRLLAAFDDGSGMHPKELRLSLTDDHVTHLRMMAKLEDDTPLPIVANQLSEKDRLVDIQQTWKPLAYPPASFLSLNQIPELERISKRLTRCRRMAKRSDPNDTAAAVFAQLVSRIIGAEMLSGQCIPTRDGKYRIAVSYPTELLDSLRRWVQEHTPNKGGRPPLDETNPALLNRVVELYQSGKKRMAVYKIVDAEFPDAELRPEQVRGMWRRFQKRNRQT